MIPYTKISGANAMYMFKLNHKQYYFFGDMHYSRRKNDCEPEVQCDDFDYSYNNINKYGKGCISKVHYYIYGFYTIIKIIY